MATSKEQQERQQEARLRAKAKREGLMMQKSRRALSLDNHGEFRLVDPATNFIVAGEKYNLTLDDVEAYLSDN